MPDMESEAPPRRTMPPLKAQAAHDRKDPKSLQARSSAYAFSQVAADSHAMAAENQRASEHGAPPTPVS